MKTWFIMCQLRVNVSKIRAGKAYTYQMLLSFKTSVTCHLTFWSACQLTFFLNGFSLKLGKGYILNFATTKKGKKERGEHFFL